MTKEEFFQRIQAELRKVLIGRGVEGITQDLEIKMDPSAQALANVVFEILMERQPTGSWADIVPADKEENDGQKNEAGT